MASKMLPQNKSETRPGSTVDKTVVVPLPSHPEEATVHMPLLADPKAFFLGGLFFFALFAVLHVASEIVIPVVLAFVLKLVLYPAYRLLGTWRFPPVIAAGVIVIVLLCGVAALGTALSGPAVAWGEKLPDSYSQLEKRLSFLRKPVEKTQEILVQAEGITNGSGPKVMPVAIQGTRLSDKVFTGTQALASGFFTTLLVLFFLLAAGDIFLRRLVEALPRFKDKRQAVDISQQVEQEISGYLLTITCVNICVGIAAGLVMWAFGVADPILWGTLAFLLNYIPIVGPLLGIGVFLVVGLLVIPNLGMALLPALLYLVIHILEGSVITPMLMARRFTLNPVLIIFSLIFWSWMWGVAGAILAMPTLAITKIVCDRIDSFKSFAHFLEGQKGQAAVGEV